MKTSKTVIVSTIVGAVCVLGLAGGCSSTPKVDYGDPTAITVLTTDFSASDLQQIAEKMVDSLLADPEVARTNGAEKPVLLVDNVKNKTMQHVDTEGLTDTIRTKLIRSRKFRFIDRTTDEAARQEIAIQQESGMVNPEAAKRLGRQIGADYLLTANLMEIRQSAGRVTDVYYKFTMNLKNLETGILEWADEKELRKVKTKKVLGF